MKSKEENLRALVAQGWTSLALVALTMFVVALMKSAVNNDFQGWATHPGIIAVHIMIVVYAIYVFMPIFIRTFHWRVFRWVVVGITVFFMLFFVAHQLSHLVTDGEPLNIFHILDFVHHFVCLWTIIYAVQWARCPD